MDVESGSPPQDQVIAWKVAWDSLPTRVLLRKRDLEILLVAYSVCGLEDVSTEHALL